MDVKHVRLGSKERGGFTSAHAERWIELVMDCDFDVSTRCGVPLITTYAELNGRQIDAGIGRIALD